jgi:hypothetical protein
MSDIFLNEDFEVEINSSGDLETVSGKERVKQSVAVHLTDEMYKTIGEVQNKERHLRLSVRRVLERHSVLEEVRNIDIVSSPASGKYRVNVNFKTSSMSFEVSE